MSAAAKSAQYYYSAGKRKTAIARVKLYDGGKGEITVNDMKIREYFPTALQTENAVAPLSITDNLKKFDAVISVQGGGKSAQSDAIRHGFSRALLLVDPDLHDLNAIEVARDGILECRHEEGRGAPFRCLGEIAAHRHALHIADVCGQAVFRILLLELPTPKKSYRHAGAGGGVSLLAHHGVKN